MNKDEETVKPEQYSEAAYIRFVRDMLKAGLEPYHYHGRFSWEGPAVNVDDIDAAMSVTRVKCQWDQMGKGFVVYPKATSGDHGTGPVRDNLGFIR